MKRTVVVILSIALVFGCFATARAERGLQYILDLIRKANGETESVETTPAAEETAPPAENKISPAKNTNDWKTANGYSFPIYGSTSVDLSPISDFLTLLEENGIYLTLPDLRITHDDEYDWIYTNIGADKRIYFRYISYFDGSRSSLHFSCPRTYRPADEVFTLMISYFLSVDITEAEELYAAAKYNVIDGIGTISTDDYWISYFEPRYSDGSLMNSVSLSVEKTPCQ